MRRAWLFLAILSVVASTAGAGQAWVPLDRWTEASPPTALSLVLRDWRRPAHGEVEAVASLRLADGSEQEVARFVPTEQGSAREVRVRLRLEPRLGAAAQRSPLHVRVRLEPIYGKTAGAGLELASARLERID
jgi:hypothetical protein